MSYDVIGVTYATQRRTDERIAAHIHAALGAARSVLNVGAGTGSYEPAGRTVAAVDASRVMLSQRQPDAAPSCVALAEALPFADGAVDAVMALLTVHHWTDKPRGLAECARVARERVVLFTYDPEADGFWLMRDYFPDIQALDRRLFPRLDALADTFSRVTINPVPIPADCADGFLGAYWKRPEAYLDPAVRAGMSAFALVSDVAPRIEALASDLSSGRWHARNGPLLESATLDIGYRLVVAER